MAIDPHAQERIRVCLAKRSAFTEKKMMGGLCFMVDDKMLVGLDKDKSGANRLMVRLDPEDYLHHLEKDGVTPMDFTGRPMRGYLFVEDFAFEDDDDLAYWLEQALAFNPKAKSSKKRK